MKKTALIVDDSKTARQVLSSKLQNYGISVDTRESAAAAIDYLYDNAPDAIFMDYEMPGMDGFQALKVIKSNPHTALIPVMMYTSKSGGLALSQARALGAVGVLPKQLESRDFEGVLSSLHLMPEQESLVSDFKDDSIIPRSQRRDNIHPISDYDRHKPAMVETVSLPLDDFQVNLGRESSLKRIFLTEQRQAEERLQEKLDQQFAQLRSEMHELEALQEEQNSSRWSPVLFGVLGGGVALAGVALVYSFIHDFSDMFNGSTVSTQNDKIMELLSAQNERIDQLSLQAGGFGGVGSGINEEALPLKLIEWAANQGTEFAYGERPFNDERALWLTELVGQLKDAGFLGTIELRANHGNFCLQKDATDKLSLAPPDLSIDKCLFAVDYRSNNDWLNDQSVAFANYINVEMARSNGELEIILFSNGFSEPLTPYPALYDVKTADEWNSVAAKNQRIQVSLYNN
ncbi:MAG: response regulator [Candidatus Thiodiazotropha sp.]